MSRKLLLSRGDAAARQQYDYRWTRTTPPPPPSGEPRDVAVNGGKEEGSFWAPLGSDEGPSVGS